LRGTRTPSKPLQKASAAFARSVVDLLKAGWLCRLDLFDPSPTIHRHLRTLSWNLLKAGWLAAAALFDASVAALIAEWMETWSMPDAEDPGSHF
jgi:hypothetical protein